MSPAYVIVCVTAALFCGVAVGAFVAVWSFRHSFDLAARYMRTGKLDAPVPVEDRAGKTNPSPEASAMRAITEDSVKRGAEQILEVAKGMGQTITRKEAEAQAREMLESLNPLGGAQ